MIKYMHDALQMPCQKTGYREYDGANAPKWNLENEPFVV